MLKRGLDLTGAVCGLALSAPLLAVVATAVLLAMGRPVLFRQCRAGKGGIPFLLLKFRTMSGARDRSGRLRPDAERITGLGRFLRGTSLDELPQLWNVLMGEMSLVGPRPLYSEYQSRYNAFQRRRLEVRPGITGWAQIHGRNALTWESRFEHDVWYVDNRSVWLDLRILAVTPGLVLRRRGIHAAGHDTMPEFHGSPPQLVKRTGEGADYA